LLSDNLAALRVAITIEEYVMPAGKNTKEVVKKVEIEVLVEGHIHEGQPCKKGGKIMVSQEVKEMLEKAWEREKKSE